MLSISLRRDGRYWLMVLLALMGSVVHAHGLQMTAQVDDGRLVGELRDSGGAPMTGLTVRLMGTRAPYETRSDPQGRFSFPLEPQLERVRVVAEDGLGHRAELAMQLVRTPQVGTLASVPRDTRWRELFAGLGYIVGLAGLAAWWLSRRSRR